MRIRATYLMFCEMRYIDEYRDARICHALAREIGEKTTRPWVLMEICGGQTHTIMRYGIDDLLPNGFKRCQRAALVSAH